MNGMTDIWMSDFISDNAMNVHLLERIYYKIDRINIYEISFISKHATSIPNADSLNSNRNAEKVHELS